MYDFSGVKKESALLRLAMILRGAVPSTEGGAVSPKYAVADGGQPEAIPAGVVWPPKEGVVPYTPLKGGTVVPLKSAQLGGDVSPSTSMSDRLLWQKKTYGLEGGIGPGLMNSPLGQRMFNPTPSISTPTTDTRFSADLGASKGLAASGDDLYKRLKQESGFPGTSLPSMQEGGEVKPSEKSSPTDLLREVIAKIKPSGMEAMSIGGLQATPESMGVEGKKYDILLHAVKALSSMVKPPTQPKAPSSKSDTIDMAQSKDGKWESRQGGGDVVTGPKTAGELRRDPAYGPGFLGGADIGISSGTPTKPTAPMETPIDRVNQFFRNLFVRNAEAGPLAPRQAGGTVTPTPETPEEEYKRLLGAAQFGPTRWFGGGGEEMQPGAPQKLMSGELLAKKNLPNTMAGSPEAAELASRKLWGEPGAEGRALAAHPGATAVTPGFEPGYYAAHPGERLRDEIEARNKPMMDMYQRLIEDARTREQGFGRGIEPTYQERRFGGYREPNWGAGIPTLAAGMERLGTVGEETGGGKGAGLPTPHFFTNEKGEHVAYYPGLGAMPTGIMSSPQQSEEERLARGAIMEEKKAHGNTTPVTTTEVANRVKQWKEDIAKAGAVGKGLGEQTAAKLDPNNFANWKQEEKNMSFENYIVNQQMPLFARGMSAAANASRQAWEREYQAYLVNKMKSPESIFEKRSTQKALGDSILKNTDYYYAVNRFAKNIDTLADRVIAFRKTWGPEFGRMVNTALNNIRNGIAGSGELANLMQNLQSLSLEVAKMESGELGISAANESQQKTWANIHNYNYNAEDIEKVVNESKNLGSIRSENLRRTINEARKTLGEKEVLPGETTPAKTEEFPGVGKGGNAPAWKLQADGTWKLE